MDYPWISNIDMIYSKQLVGLGLGYALLTAQLGICEQKRLN